MNLEEIVSDLRSTLNLLYNKFSKNEEFGSDEYHAINNSRIALDELEKKNTMPKELTDEDAIIVAEMIAQGQYESSKIFWYKIVNYFTESNK